MRLFPTALALAALSGCAHASPRRPVAAAAVGAEPGPPGAVVDKVVAFVGNRPITLSECALEVRIDRALAGDLDGALGPVRESDEAKVLPELVDRAAVLKALKRNYEGALESGASKDAARALRARFPSDDAWRRFLEKLELSDDEVEERLRRRIEYQTILILRLKDMIRVARKDEDDWLAAHPGATREQASSALAFEAANLAKPGILSDARRAALARVVDPIVAPPEEPGSAVGTSGTPEKAR